MHTDRTPPPTTKCVSTKIAASAMRCGTSGRWSPPPGCLRAAAWPLESRAAGRRPAGSHSAAAPGRTPRAVQPQTSGPAEGVHIAQTVGFPSLSGMLGHRFSSAVKGLRHPYPCRSGRYFRHLCRAGRRLGTGGFNCGPAWAPSGQDSRNHDRRHNGLTEVFRGNREKFGKSRNRRGKTIPRGKTTVTKLCWLPSE